MKNMRKLVLVLLLIFAGVLIFISGAFAATGIWTNPKGLKVYIPKNDMLTVTMTHAFQEWQRKTNNYFTFQFVNTKSTAQITVIFVDSGIPEVCKSEDALGCTQTKTAINHLGERIKQANIYISRKSNTGRVMSHTQVYTIMLHEIGHALGLNHTQNPQSIMYAGTNQSMAVKQEIRTSDLNLLYDLYHPKKQQTKK